MSESNGRDDAGAQTPDRVRESTTAEVNATIDRDTEARLVSYAMRDRGEIDRRLRELDGEWEMERTLEANASALALTGAVLGVAHSRRWLVVPGVVFTFLLMHGVHGWCPPVPLFRRLGFRTRREIDRERYALKALRGDFAAAPEAEGAGAGTVADRALEAARR